MNKTKIYLGLCVLSLALLWSLFFKSLEPSNKIVTKKDSFKEEVLNNAKDVDKPSFVSKPKIKTQVKKITKKPKAKIKKSSPEIKYTLKLKMV